MAQTQEIIRPTRTLQSVGVYRNQWVSTATLSLTMVATREFRQRPLMGSAYPRMSSPLSEPRHAGPKYSPEEDRPDRPEEMILSYDLCTRRFTRDRNVVGRIVQVNGHSCLALGVMPSDFNFPLRRATANTPSPYVEFWATLRNGGPSTSE